MTKTIPILVIASVFALGLLSFNQDASAGPGIFYELNADTCPTFGGVWNAGTNTCTITTNGNTVLAGDELFVPSGTTLVISNAAGAGLKIDGTLTNSGTITVSNSGSSTGIRNDGTLTNNSGGQITVSNTDGTGIDNRDTLTNNGTITVSNTVGSTGISNSGDSILTNNSGGTITVQNSGSSTGIRNDGTLTNNGTITVKNSGSSTGIDNDGTLTNNSGGQITVSNTGGTGILNDDENSTLANNSGGQITVSNTGGTGILNGELITNSGTITVANSGASTGIDNGLGDTGLANSGTIDKLCNATYTGNLPSGNPINVISCPPATLSPSKDSYLRKLLPNINEGANKKLFVTWLGSDRTLVGFDPTQISSAISGKTLQSATLKLYITNNLNDWGSTGRDIEVRPLQTSWPEGNGYNEKIVIPVKGTGHGVTWNCADDSNINNNIQNCPTKWNGGKFGAVASKVKITNGKTGWISFDVKSDIENGLSSNGWIIKKSDESKLGAILFASREASSNTPVLELTFAP